MGYNKRRRDWSFTDFLETGAAVKVIVTRFVQTDEAQFKHVVQSLTGKDSAACEGGRVAVSGGGARKNEFVNGVARRSEAVATGGVVAEEEASAFGAEGSPTMDELFELLGY
ncbi:hypothetical protein KSP39_PZI013641 [Platanthera zijinensis]|uniref:VQ domain-containing protein n=1 Tax=Platanthera zijinensis TaxID=2320716 RepID=A0AAP0G3Y7_9ASPA